MAQADQALARSRGVNLYLSKGQQRQSVQSSRKRGAFFIKGLAVYQKFPPDRATLECDTAGRSEIKSLHTLLNGFLSSAGLRFELYCHTEFDGPPSRPYNIFKHFI